MKNNIYFFALITLSLFTISCGNDDDSSPSSDESPASFIESNDVTDELVVAEVSYYGEIDETGIYDFAIYLDTSTDNSNTKTIGLSFHSSTPNVLAPGTYNFGNTVEAFIFNAGEFIDNTGPYYITDDIVRGSVTIIKGETDYYELTFDCTGRSARKFIGQYYGAVELRVF